MHAVSSATSTPSPLWVAVLTVLLTAILFSLGWLIRQVWAWSKRVNADNALILSNQDHVKSVIPKIVKDVKREQRRGRRHAKIIERLVWIMEQREQAALGTAGHLAVRTRTDVHAITDQPPQRNDS